MKLEIQPNAVYSIKEVTQITGLCRDSIIKYITLGRLKAIKLQRIYKILGSELLEFFK